MQPRSVLVTSLVLVTLLLGAAGASADEAGPTAPAAPAGNGFTYQGQIQSGGSPVNGPCDMGFRLYGAATGGSPLAGVLSVTVPVTASLFTVGLDFGALAFDGSARWLDLTVRCPAGSGAFATLSPRQALTAAPYALYALNNWGLRGNAGTNSASNFLGTTDNLTLTLRVNNATVMRYVPGPFSPNILGGSSVNTIVAGSSGVVIAGGGQTALPNEAYSSFSTISGGYGNGVYGASDVVAGGFTNYATSTGSVVSGGQLNQASQNFATVSGGYNNNASGSNANVGGGQNNTASGDLSTVAGGGSNQAAAYGATVSGGGSSSASGLYATVGGGNGNAASADGATIGGGGWDGTGYNGNIASGQAATVPGGWGNRAFGDYSLAAGKGAGAVYDGDFVWADSTGAVLSATTANQFLVRASGGITLYSNAAASSGAALLPGSGAWSILSDRNLKANMSAVDGRQVLDALAGIPIQTWNYTTQDSAIRHIGPMAQDFHAAFGVGENDTTISTVDAQGVALAAIQGLYQLNQGQAAQLESQQSQIAALQTRLAALEQHPAASPQLPLTTSQLPPLPWLLFGGLLLLNLGGLLGYLLARGRRVAGGAA